MSSSERPPLEDMTLRQLRRVASEYGISRYSRMRKDQLLSAIQEIERTRFAPSQLPSRSLEAQEEVEAAKFDVGQSDREEALAAVDEELAELPNGYGESRVVLMPRDPQWAYTYWDIPNENKERLRQQGGIRLALRFYDVTDISVETQRPHSLQQYECDELAREWYLPVPVSDRDYIVEIGYVTVEGNWLLLARSAAVRIPPIYPSDWIDDQFITISWDEELRAKTFLELAYSNQRLAPISNPIYDKVFQLAESAEAQRVAGSVFGSMHQVPEEAVSSYVFPSGVGKWASGAGMSGAGMYTESGAGMYSESGVGMYSESGVGMYSESGVGMYSESGIGMYSQSGVGMYTESGVGMYSESGVGMYTQSGAGMYTQSGAGMYTESGAGMYTESGVGMYSESGVGMYTQSGVGMSGVGMAVPGYSMSGVGMSGVGMAYTQSGVGMSGVGMMYSESGVGMSGVGMAVPGYSMSGVGMSGVGMMYSESGVGMSGVGMMYTQSGVGMSGVGMTVPGYSMSGVGMSGVGMAYTQSGVGMSGVGMAVPGYSMSGVGMSGVGMMYTQSGVGMSGVGMTVPGYTMSGVGMSGVGMAYTQSGVGMSGVGMMYSMSGVGMSGVGFSASMPPIRPRKFWLIADAELIVYGATEPDANLTIGGRPVKLNPDGTFRFQMSFPDGLIDFPIMAVAADGEQMRSIHMTFTRETPERKTNTKEEAVLEWMPQEQP